MQWSYQITENILKFCDIKTYFLFSKTNRMNFMSVNSLLSKVELFTIKYSNEHIVTIYYKDKTVCIQPCSYPLVVWRQNPTELPYLKMFKINKFVSSENISILFNKLHQKYESNIHIKHTSDLIKFVYEHNTLCVIRTPRNGIVVSIRKLINHKKV